MIPEETGILNPQGRGDGGETEAGVARGPGVATGLG